MTSNSVNKSNNTVRDNNIKSLLKILGRNNWVLYTTQNSNNSEALNKELHNQECNQLHYEYKINFYDLKYNNYDYILAYDMTEQEKKELIEGAKDVYNNYWVISNYEHISLISNNRYKIQLVLKKQLNKDAYDFIYKGTIPFIFEEVK